MIVAFLFTVNASHADTIEAKEGLYVGLDLVVNIPEQDLRGDFADVDPGSGLDVKLGYRFPIPLALEIEFGASGHRVEDGDAGIGFFVIDLRYFPFVFSDRPLYPYIRVGVGAYALVIEDARDISGRRDDLELTGEGFDVGIGFDFYVTPEVSIGVGLTQRFVKYDELDYLNFELPEDVKGAMTSLNAGVQYHF
jgi:opacity protein-like surface antigen